MKRMPLTLSRLEIVIMVAVAEQVDEPKHEQLPDPAGTPEKADPQETLQPPDQLQDIRVIYNGKVGDAADGHPDPVTVVPEELAAVKPGSVEINDLGIPAVSPALKGGLLSGSEVSGIRPDLAAGETDSLLDASGRGQDFKSEVTADKVPVPQPSLFTSLPQLAERGRLLHASQAPGSSTTEESISAPDSEADDEVTGMLRQDSYHSEQHEGSGLPGTELPARLHACSSMRCYLITPVAHDVLLPFFSAFFSACRARPATCM
jgi:hypothetical protein